MPTVLTCPGESGSLVDVESTDQQCRNAWLPFFCGVSKGCASVLRFLECYGSFLPDVEVVTLPHVDGEMLMDRLRGLEHGSWLFGWVGYQGARSFATHV